MVNQSDESGSDAPNPPASDGDDEESAETGSEDPPLADPETADEVIEEFIEQRDLDDESWVDDGGKVRCPECGAVHEERQDECRVCGWEAP